MGAGRLDSDLERSRFCTLACVRANAVAPRREHGEALFLTSVTYFVSAADAAACFAAGQGATSIRGLHEFRQLRTFEERMAALEARAGVCHERLQWLHHGHGHELV